MAAQIFYVVMLTWSIPKVMRYSGGMKLLDLRPTGYSPEEARQLLDTLGETERNIYRFQQIPLDMFYPALFAIAYCLLLALIFRNAFSQKNPIRNAVVIPVFVGLFDYLENIGIFLMLSIYPSFHPWLVNLTSVFSLFKSLLTTLTFLLLIIGLVALAMNRLKNKKMV